MTSPVATPSNSRFAARILAEGSANSRSVVTLVVIGAIAWAGLVYIGVQLALAGPPGVGFDLELLVDAGRKAAAGTGMYSPALLAGDTVPAQSLFYSYPPYVGQAMALIAWLPTPVILVAWAGIATLGLAVVSVRVARGFRPAIPALAVALPVVVLAPLVLPYAISVLFGNFNMFFAALYGLILLAALAPEGERAPRVVGGVALGIAAATKIHPASLGLWFLVRGWQERRDGGRPVSWLVLGAAVGTGLVLVVSSLIVGGVQPWLDYLAVVRASSGATLLDHRNYGPAAILGQAIGLSEAAVRAVHLVVLGLALAVTAWAAWRRTDTVTSLGIAAVASLVILPVTWIHYPAALIPFVVAALVRGPTSRTRALAAAAGVAVLLAIAVPPLLWLGIGLVVIALGSSGTASAQGPRPAATAA